MTSIIINDINPRVSFVASSGQLIFTYPFPTFSAGAVKVLVNDVLLSPDNYSVTGLGEAAGGTIIATTGIAEGDAVVIYRDTPVTRITNFQPNGDLTAEALNTEFSTQILMIQELTGESSENQIRFSNGVDGLPINALTQSVENRANKLLSFNDAGQPIIAQELGQWRGNWATDTAYSERDIVRDSSNNDIFIALTKHNSIGDAPIASNPGAANWDVLIEVSSTGLNAEGAAVSAAAAKVSEDAAFASAGAASTSSGASASMATFAAASAGAAATSETNAGTSETNAGTSETNASTSATNAATSETNAATSATNAATSETNAATSETNAATSETNAQTHATSVLAAGVLSTDNTWTGDQTLRDITETQVANSTSFTVDLANGSVFTLTAAGTVTLPAAEMGKSFTLIVTVGTNLTITGVRWSRGATPTKGTGIDIYSFISDGTNWYGGQSGTNFAT